MLTLDMGVRKGVNLGHAKAWREGTKVRIHGGVGSELSMAGLQEMMELNGWDKSFPFTPKLPSHRPVLGLKKR